MSGQGIVLVGTGAIAQEIAETFSDVGFVAAYCEPAFAAASRVDLPLVTDPARLRDTAASYVVAIADPADRARLAAQLDALGLRAAPPLVPSTARVSRSARLGDGTVLGHGVQVGPDSRIGRHGLVLHHAVFGHDARAGDHLLVGPGVHIAGDTVIGHGVAVLANATIAKGLVVGDNARILPSAACFRAVPAGATMIGNPARVLRRTRD